MSAGRIVVSLPTASWVRALGPVEGADVVVWDGRGPAPHPAPDLVVPDYVATPDLSALPAATRAVQLLTIGYDGVPEQLPAGVLLCNAAGVHETSTAELAVGLAILALRGLDDDVRAMATGEWKPSRRTSLADRRVLVVGWGGVGRAVADRLAPFECAVTAVGTRARVQDGVAVRASSELPGLLPEHDVVVLACPLTAATRGLAGAGFLAAMPDGALLVNVARGPVVDTAALVAELRTGRLRAALDVTDPEPLPADHELWSLPGVVVTPHVGGNSTAFRPRMLRLLREQVARLVAGQEPVNVVAPATASS
ncbi:2-hydroxyacid dehydrogenase [Kineococcus radiotolerans]|uniref:D-isomer specific 2-hydroxyacid dehydrogenase NAD-binding n=1 Tax=Kineococcus radiotolerans (strain ATCC BAA-149 / DSM 14245 / SRS30216) TaxID=266940 RepID=A6W7M2_KINRD|nr:2-hydroxyacid dehydrogenase [Kineococcus radiotolerans]ABS02811.1 D-isomer specific 2-hydroxyacid dehydrogenase NAD-binding [Kineococcus radiotolerans SRS30216 = ATCC BAA-149]